MSRSRRWCFTLNELGVTNANDERGDRVGAFEEYVTRVLAVIEEDRHQDELLDYIGGQIEENKQGGLHWQGVLHCRQPVALQRLIDWFLPQHPHFERMRGSWAQAKAYCQKTESRVVAYRDAGVEPDQGCRTDLADLYNRLRSGESKLEVADAFPGQFVRYHRAFDAIQSLVPHRGINDSTNAVFIYGPPGVGKSRFARNLVSTVLDHTFWFANIPGHAWFDGLEPFHKFAIFDDCDSSLLPVRTLLRMLDYGPLTVNIKGQSAKWRVKTAIFTNNHDLELTFPHEPQHAVTRRFQVVIRFDANSRMHYETGDEEMLLRLMGI